MAPPARGRSRLGLLTWKQQAALRTFDICQVDVMSLTATGLVNWHYGCLMESG
jgi:hypothetical protein